MAADENTAPETATIADMATIATDGYSCEGALKQLNDYLDHELSTEQRAHVVRHLATCKACLDRFYFEEQLVIQLRKRMLKSSQASADKSHERRADAGFAQTHLNDDRIRDAVRQRLIADGNLPVFTRERATVAIKAHLSKSQSLKNSGKPTKQSRADPHGPQYTP